MNFMVNDDDDDFKNNNSGVWIWDHLDFISRRSPMEIVIILSSYEMEQCDSLSGTMQIRKPSEEEMDKYELNGLSLHWIYFNSSHSLNNILLYTKK